MSSNNDDFDILDILKEEILLLINVSEKKTETNIKLYKDLSKALSIISSLEKLCKDNNINIEHMENIINELRGQII